ncbi:MAG: hypothetical protein H6600_06000 [Flavobacteriales bacterium]|nr:hypothetical protein [Flavobacteriales bacterium]MCB9197995.1 hypothetical protein [Flavobacteriales bacterium]
MTKEEAITYLGGNEQQVEEFLTQHIFELKSNQLKSTILPQVLYKKSDKLFNMAEALTELGYEDEQFDYKTNNLILKSASRDDLISFFRSYEQELSRLKLYLMNAYHPRIVGQILKALADLESSKWTELNQRLGDLSINEEVKLSEYVDSGMIILELRNTKEDFDPSAQLDQLSTFKKEIGKSVKYCKFTESKRQ